MAPSVGVLVTHTVIMPCHAYFEGIQLSRYLTTQTGVGRCLRLGDSMMMIIIIITTTGLLQLD